MGQSLALGASFRTRRKTDALSLANPATRELGRARESGLGEKRTGSREDLGGPRSPLRLGNLAGKHRNATRIGVNFSLARPTKKRLLKSTILKKCLLLDFSPFL